MKKLSAALFFLILLTVGCTKVQTTAERSVVFDVREDPCAVKVYADDKLVFELDSAEGVSCPVPCAGAR